MGVRVYVDAVSISTPEPVEAWMSKAECTTVDPEAFFPLHNRSDRSRHGHRSADFAKTICQSCPVRMKCLAFAMASERSDGRRFGVFGGLTAAERSALQKALSNIGAQDEVQNQEDKM